MPVHFLVPVHSLLVSIVLFRLQEHDRERNAASSMSVDSIEHDRLHTASTQQDAASSMKCFLARKITKKNNCHSLILE